jgi:hypothetical protein
LGANKCLSAHGVPFRPHRIELLEEARYHNLIRCLDIDFRVLVGIHYGTLQVMGLTTVVTADGF